jgi:hypothetical protein
VASEGSRARPEARASLAQPQLAVAKSGRDPARLFASNDPATFWKLLIEPGPTEAEWWSAALTASDVLPEAARNGTRDLDDLLDRILGEAQFGPGHFRLSGSKRAYYALKGILPRPLTRTLRRAHRHLSVQNFGLDWPVESRYVAFVRATLAQLLRARGMDSVPFVHFWPQRRRWALVLTHDVETATGQALIPVLAGIEERLGFRSSFNLVPERYELDRGLIFDLRRRGFEVGVHDLYHDGKLFNSRSKFIRRARHINRHIREIEADGFRAALMHRNPDWMQALDVDYDLSFFDTDPYEPIPGGTMSIWPFQLGRFVELPYTLVQDYTLTAVLREQTPRLWTEKAGFVAEHCGMVLLNAHPDYLRQNEMERVYTEFLETIRGQGGYWHALPREIARWWRARADASTLASLPGATISRARVAPSELGGVELRLAADD